MNKNKILSLASVFLLGLMNWASSANAAVIVTTSNGTTNGTSSNLNVTGKGIGITMPSGSDYTLTSIDVQLRFTSNTTVFGYIYSNDGSNTPGTLLSTLTIPTPIVDSAIHTYTYTPTSTFTLSASTSYWFVLAQSAGGNAVSWASSTPAGFYSSSIGATKIGTGGIFGNYNGVDQLVENWTSASGVLNSMTINAVLAVPEPETYSLLFMAGVGLLFWQRRKASVSRI